MFDDCSLTQHVHFIHSQEAKKLAKQKEEEGGDEGDKDADDAGDDEVFYGAPDDHAWTDASHAIKEASNNKDEGPDMSVSLSCCQMN